jgi:hypothetical protein
VPTSVEFVIVPPRRPASGATVRNARPSNTKLTGLLEGQPKDVQAEIVRIDTAARPIVLQIALLGLFDGFRMVRQPDPRQSKPTASGGGEASLLG